MVRLGIGKSKEASIPDDVDWRVVKALADRQGLSAVVLDGIEVLRSSHVGNLNHDQVMLLEWIGEVMQGYEQRYIQYERTIGEMADFYNRYGLKMMVLKGYACSLNWPRPEHRPCGDIDIWLFGRYREADKWVAKEKGLKIDSSHHHHTVFYWGEWMVENHYDFLNVHYGHKNDKIEKILKSLGTFEVESSELKVESHLKGCSDAGCRIPCVEVEGERVYLPSANLHALFLLRHMLHNFTSTGMNLRQLLDWAFLVERHGKEIDWQWLTGVLEEYHMTEFVHCIVSIAVDDLGFSSTIFPSVERNPALKGRVLNDILSPEFSEDTPQKFLPRMIFKYRRWQANAWKQNLCYDDSRFKAFWQGVWGHLLKPGMV